MKKKFVLIIPLIFIMLGCASERTINESEVEIKVKENRHLVYEKETNKPFTGVVIKKHPNGKIASKEFYKNGINHGPYVFWHQNGRKAGEFNYKEGRRDGKVTQWDKNGNILVEAEFKENTTVGHQTMYYSTGEKWSYLSWDKGGRSSKTWDRKGKLISNGRRSMVKNEDGAYYATDEDGTFYNTDYEIPIIEKYSKGKLISTTDLDGNPIDTKKLKKNY